MFPRALACAAFALLLAACRGSGERDASTDGLRALDAGARGPAHLGPALDAAGVEPRFVPALEALERAVSAGEDDSARALVARLDSLGPTDRVWQLVRTFERILDGRAAVKSLHLALVCLPEPLEPLFAEALEGAQAWRLCFVAENSTADAIELSPGPATLFSNRTELYWNETAQGRKAGEASAQETRNFDRLKKLHVPPGEKAEVELARFFLAPRAGQVAVRLAFDLELRAGALVQNGRELPAMHFNVDPACVVRAAPGLSQEPVTLAELVAQLDQSLKSDELLELVVRVPGEECARVLEELAKQLVDRPRTTLERWLPSLRWLAGSDAPTDVDRMRSWLRERQRAREKAVPRPDLQLPRSIERAPEPGGETQKPKESAYAPNGSTDAPKESTYAPTERARKSKGPADSSTEQAGASQKRASAPIARADALLAH